MAPGDDSPDQASELRVTDRRRFTETGDEREPVEATPREPQPPPAGAAVPPAPEASKAAPAEPPPPPPPPPRHAAGARSTSDGASEPPRAGGADVGMVMDLGIQAVFLLFYQSAMIALGALDASGEPGPVDL